MVQADEVKKLVARREPHLSQALVGFHAGRQPDLIAIRPVPAAATRVVAIERTACAEGADLGGEACEGAFDEPRPRCDVEIRLGAPELVPQSCELARSKSPLGKREDDMPHGVGDRTSRQFAMRRGHRAEYQASRAARSARSAGFSVSS